MIPGQTCGNCAAFAAMAGECRRHSPVPVPFEEKPGQMRSIGFHPGTAKDRWCLEWIADPKALS